MVDSETAIGSLRRAVAPGNAIAATARVPQSVLRNSSNRLIEFIGALTSCVSGAQARRQQSETTLICPSAARWPQAFRDNTR